MLASSHAVVHVVAVLVGIVVVLLYLVPTGIALFRRHHWILRIAVVNILLGWTVIGWVMAFHMASTSRTKTQGYWRPPVGGVPTSRSSVPVQLDEAGKAPAETHPTPTFAPGTPLGPSPSPGVATWPTPRPPSTPPRPSGSYGLPPSDAAPDDLT